MMRVGPQFKFGWGVRSMKKGRYRGKVSTRRGGVSRSQCRLAGDDAELRDTSSGPMTVCTESAELTLFSGLNRCCSKSDCGD